MSNTRWMINDYRTFRLNHVQSNRWVLQIDGQTGKITLNPDIPQDEAVQVFVQLVNEVTARNKPQ